MSWEAWGNPPETEERLSSHCEVDEHENCPGAGSEANGYYERSSGEFDEYGGEAYCPCECHCSS